MVKTMLEPSRRTSLLAEVDVVVAGAGPAGLAAAIGAAQAGARTLLLEKHGCFGGMLTAGAVLNIRQFNDGERQVIAGVAARLAEEPLGSARAMATCMATGHAAGVAAALAAHRGVGVPTRGGQAGGRML